MQTDLFASDEKTVRSYPPHLDPDRAHETDVVREEDTDHVASNVNGCLPVGALGNNAEVWIVRVFDRGGAILGAFRRDTKGAAYMLQDEILASINSNKQGILL